MSPALDLLQQATLELTSADPIKHRLISAFSSYLEPLDASGLPVELREPFADLLERLTCITPLRGESAVVATVRKMSNEDAGDCAREIVRLLAGMAQHDHLEVKPRKQEVSAPLWALEA
ncbi:MAG: hypothetical protein ACO213_11285 [Steroidobacteraceae bacterium]